MLRDYTICMLSKLTKTGGVVKEPEIIEWVNKKVIFLSSNFSPLHHDLKSFNHDAF